MRYCKNCGSKMDELDGYCSNCGVRVDLGESMSDSYKEDFANHTYENKKDRRASIEDSLNGIGDLINDNTYAFISFLCGVLSLTIGTFACAIVSLVFGKKALEKCRREGALGENFCKIGMLCSKICIVISSAIAAVALLVFCIPLIAGL